MNPVKRAIKGRVEFPIKEEAWTPLKPDEETGYVTRRRGKRGRKGKIEEVTKDSDVMEKVGRRGPHIRSG